MGGFDDPAQHVVDQVRRLLRQDNSPFGPRFVQHRAVVRFDPQHSDRLHVNAVIGKCCVCGCHLEGRDTAREPAECKRGHHVVYPARLDQRADAELFHELDRAFHRAVQTQQHLNGHYVHGPLQCLPHGERTAVDIAEVAWFVDLAGDEGDLNGLIDEHRGGGDVPLLQGERENERFDGGSRLAHRARRTVKLILAAPADHRQDVTSLRIQTHEGSLRLVQSFGVGRAGRQQGDNGLLRGPLQVEVERRVNPQSACINLLVAELGDEICLQDVLDEV